MRIEDMIEGFEQRLRYYKNTHKATSKIIYMEVMRDYYARVANARKENKPLAWVNPGPPAELCYAMDIVPFYFEQYTLQVLASERGLQYFDIAQAYGYSTEACSLHLATVGMVKAGIFDLPDIFIASSYCGSIGMMDEVLSNMLNIPTFFLNWPYRIDDEAVEHFRSELEDMARFIEENTGHKLDTGRLRELLENDKIALDYLIKIGELRKNLPCPLGGRDAFAAFPLRGLNQGLPGTIKYFEAQYQEVKDKVKRGEGHLADERYRLVAFGTYPTWHMKLFDWIESEFKAVIVVDLMNGFPQTGIDNTSDLLRGLARKLLEGNGGGMQIFGLPFYPLMQTMAKTAEEAKANAAIFFANFGCKITSGGCFKIFVDELKRVGIPTLVLDMDATNPAVVSLEQMKFKIGEYFNTLGRG